MATATHAGGPKELHLERFTEALQDPNSRLTYAALSGQRNQSIRDAERLLSQEMVNFMKKHGYILKLNTSVLSFNWRRASDERGLSELQRSMYNYQM